MFSWYSFSWIHYLIIEHNFASTFWAAYSLRIIPCARAFVPSFMLIYSAHVTNHEMFCVHSFIHHAYFALVCHVSLHTHRHITHIYCTTHPSSFVLFLSVIHCADVYFCYMICIIYNICKSHLFYTSLFASCNALCTLFAHLTYYNTHLYVVHPLWAPDYCLFRIFLLTSLFTSACDVFSPTFL
jgi:hypothetical protein